VSPDDVAAEKREDAADLATDLRRRCVLDRAERRHHRELLGVGQCVVDTLPAAVEEHLLMDRLGDQTRRALLARLAQRSATVTELAEPFEMSLPAISRHIKVLERARLIERTVDGRVHHCALDVEPLQTVDEWLRRYRRFWDASLDALAKYVER
jgi:DNA-binding transcriptional ArsR family regulator